METECIPIIDAFISEDNQVFVIEKIVVNDLLANFGGIHKVPNEKKVNARKCYTEREIGINCIANDFVYRIGEVKEVDRINHLKKLQIRCSDFSVFYYPKVKLNPRGYNLKKT